MNREIKIKVVTISNVDNRLIEISEPMSVKKVGDYIDERRDKDGVERYEYIQWTGLNDKNGKDIWEGDVVKYEVGCSDGSVYKKIASVEYGEFNCSCCDGVYGGYFDDGDIREAERYEVIGNIYENPDLLNK